MITWPWWWWRRWWWLEKEFHSKKYLSLTERSQLAHDLQLSEVHFSTYSSSTWIAERHSIRRIFRDAAVWLITFPNCRLRFFCDNGRRTISTTCGHDGFRILAWGVADSKDGLRREKMHGPRMGLRLKRKCRNFFRSFV